MSSSLRAVLSSVLVAWAAASTVIAQNPLLDLMERYGVEVPGKNLETAFDSGVAPAVAVTPAAFAAPLAMLTAGLGSDRIAGAFAFGILAGRSGKAAAPAEVAAAGQSLVQMIGSEDRRSRIAGARVAGRIFALPFEEPVRQSGSTRSGTLPAGMTEALFALLNRENEYEQLAAMDALGLIRERDAVSSLTSRYAFYRKSNKRPLAGGALEALARIGDPSTVELVKQLESDKWSEGRDPTALAAAFARERLLRDGSIAVLRRALEDKARRTQARGYLIELGMQPVP